jgi:hypothetical protein
MNQILQAVQNQLSEVPGINYIDENTGQLDAYSPNYPVKWPCVLLDINNARFSNLGMDKSRQPMQRQIGEFNLEVRVANLKLTNSSAKAPSRQKEQAASIWELIEEIHKALHGWRPNTMSGALIRTTVNRVLRDDGVQEYAIVYSSDVQNV